MNDSDPVSEFQSAMMDYGLATRQPICADGRLHRFDIEGDRKGSGNGFYVVHLDGRPAGMFGCWKRGIKATWKANGAPLSEFERAELMRKVEADRKRRQREEAKRHKDTAEAAAQLLSSYKPASTDHPYLVRKQINPHGAMIDGQGRLVLAMSDAAGAIWSIQTIDGDGTKLFMPGGRQHGCMFVIGEPSNRMVIAEGFSTGASIHEATGLCVVVAFNAGNLEPVAQALRAKWPLAQLVIAADDDRETRGPPIDNPGIHFARRAADAVGGFVAAPTFREPKGRTDFNDLAIAEGREAVAAIILETFTEKAKPPAREEPQPHPGDTRIAPRSEPVSEPAESDTYGEKRREDNRPVIRVTLGQLPEAVAKSNRALAKHSRSMFVLGDLLVTLEEVDGRLQTVPVTQTRIGLELARVARFEKYYGEKDGVPQWVAADPPLKLAAAIADEPGGWRSPVLIGLTEVPILRPNGAVVTTPGYDPTSRLHLHGGPFLPAGRDPKAALAVLLDALSEFPFVERHHRSGALAMLLTAVSRRQLPTAPLFGISSREAGTGKGALASLAAIMATGRRAPETPWPTNSDEQRKVITATLIGGAPMLILDNIVGDLDSTALCVLLTAETWSDRVLGQSRNVQLPASLLAVATGNNLKVVGDLCRRILPIEMDAGVESPELREFERALVPWAIENRPKLVAAAITILSAYRKAGSPLPSSFNPLGSFEVWSHQICGAIMWLGQPDPRQAMAASRENDPRRQILGNVLAGMHSLFDAQFQTSAAIFRTAKEAGADRGQDLWEAVEAITMKGRDEKACRIIFGRWLDEHRGRVVGGLRLEIERDTHRKINLWRAAPV